MKRHCRWAPKLIITWRWFYPPELLHFTIPSMLWFWWDRSSYKKIEHFCQFAVLQLSLGKIEWWKRNNGENELDPSNIFSYCSGLKITNCQLFLTTLSGLMTSYNNKWWLGFFTLDNVDTDLKFIWWIKLSSCYLIKKKRTYQSTCSSLL